MAIYETAEACGDFVARNVPEIILQCNVDADKRGLVKGTEMYNMFVAYFWGWHTSGAFDAVLTPELIAEYGERAAELAGFGTQFNNAVGIVSGATAAEWALETPAELET